MALMLAGGWSIPAGARCGACHEASTPRQIARIRPVYQGGGYPAHRRGGSPLVLARVDWQCPRCGAWHPATPPAADPDRETGETLAGSSCHGR